MSIQACALRWSRFGSVFAVALAFALLAGCQGAANSGPADSPPPYSTASEWVMPARSRPTGEAVLTLATADESDEKGGIRCELITTPTIGFTRGCAWDYATNTIFVTIGTSTVSGLITVISWDPLSGRFATIGSTPRRAGVNYDRFVVSGDNLNFACTEGILIWNPRTDSHSIIAISNTKPAFGLFASTLGLLTQSVDGALRLYGDDGKITTLPGRHPVLQPYRILENVLIAAEPASLIGGRFTTIPLADSARPAAKRIKSDLPTESFPTDVLCLGGRLSAVGTVEKPSQFYLSREEKSRLWSPKGASYSRFGVVFEKHDAHQ